MSVSSRSHVVIAIIGAVAAVAVGILGNYLVNRWSWGLAAAVLTMTSVVAGIEGAKTLITHRAASDTLVEPSDAGPTVHSATVLGDQVTMNQSVVAAGNVDQSRRTHVHLGGLAAVILAVSALLAVAVGTGRLAKEPGGRLAERAIPSPSRALDSASPSHDSPDLVLYAYIRDKFHLRESSDDIRRLECASSRLTSVDQLLSDIERREADFGVQIKVALRDMAVTASAATATISTELVLQSGNQSSGEVQQLVQRWSFDLANQDGWRVCTARKLD